MKVNPVLTGTTAVYPNEGMAAAPDRMARAKQIAAGQTPTETPTSGDRQVDRAQNSLKKIKLKTQVSPDRHLQELPTETATVETPGDTLAVNEPTVAATEETKPLSPQFAALAREKRALQLEKQKLLAQQKEFDAASGSRTGLEEYRNRIKANALSVLLEEGVTYDQLTEQILAQDKQGIDTEALNELRAKIKALEEGVDQKFTAREVQAEEAALTNILGEAEQMANIGEDYLLIKEANAFEDVLRTIYNHYKKTGQLLDTKAVMDRKETELLNESIKWAKISKVQSKLNPAPQPQTQPVKQDQPGVKVMRTLTNRDGSSSVSMSKRERAIAAMEGRLK
jgi:hypothetical protein